jgi:hypothetical protein
MIQARLVGRQIPVEKAAWCAPPAPCRRRADAVRRERRRSGERRVDSSGEGLHAVDGEEVLAVERVDGETIPGPVRR